MMGFDYEVVWSSNMVADALSRRPYGELQVITLFHIDLLKMIKLSWTTDPYLVQLISQLQQRSKVLTKYLWQNNQLRQKGKQVVGDVPNLKTKLLHHFHSSVDGGHSGVKPTMARIKSVLYWKGLKKQVRVCPRVPYLPIV